MKALLKSIIMLLFAVVMGCIVGCTKPNDNNSGGNQDNDVIVTTYTPSDVTASTAVSGCSVQVRQGLSLTEIGVCWSTSANPTAEDSQLSSEAWNEPFVKTLTGLSPNTTYHVRAFALRGLEYYYGEEKTFTTLAEGGGNNGGGSNTPVLPTVITAQVTDITQNTAQCGGNVTSDGGATVMERGICWGTSHNPNTSGSHIANGNGTGSYIVSMTGLVPGTMYYVRAYAINSHGTSYGDEVHFTTLSVGGGNGGGYGPPPTGAINGVFSVSPTKQVWFSQGNLQYNAAQGSHQCADGTTKQGTWRFAEKQWHYVGGKDYHGNIYGNVSGSNDNISPTYSLWIDLFGWGTSGWNNGNVYYHPYDYQIDYTLNNYGNIISIPSEGYGPTDGVGYQFDLIGEFAKADWGVYNSISNGGGQPNQWRTLTQEEWNYLFTERMTSTVNGVPNARFAWAKVNNVLGMILFPDSYVHPSGVRVPLAINLTGNLGSASNIYSIANWEKMEEAGCVFMPQAGLRKYFHSPLEGWYIYLYFNPVYYWCSNHYSESEMCACIVCFGGNNETSLSLKLDWYQGRSVGCAVRLVQDCQ